MILRQMIFIISKHDLDRFDILYFCLFFTYHLFYRVRCDNTFVGIYREHISDVKSRIVLGNKKSLDINIIPTKRDPTFGTGKRRRISINHFKV